MTPDREKVLEVVERYTGGHARIVELPIRERLMRLLHPVGIHWRRESFMWDEETGAFYAMGKRCRFCEIPES